MHYGSRKNGVTGGGGDGRVSGGGECRTNTFEGVGALRQGASGGVTGGAKRRYDEHRRDWRGQRRSHERG